MAWLTPNLKKWKEGQSFLLRYRVNGVIESKSLGKVSKKVARDAMRAATLQEKQKGKVAAITIDISDTCEGKTFNQFIDGYVDDYAKAHPKTAHDVASRFREGGDIRAHFGNLVIANGEAIADRWVKAWVEYKSERIEQAAPRTVQREWQYLNAALNRAASQYRLCRVSPLAGAKLDLFIPETEISYFEPADLEMIYEADPASAVHHRYLVNVGIRRGEAVRLERKDVGREEMRVVPGKGNKGRTIPLSPGAQEARERILFDHPGGDPFFAGVHQDTWTTRFRRAREKAGLEEGTLHWLRHTFISTLINDRGQSLPVVKELAGHANIETTMKYVHVKERHIRDAVAGLSL